MPLSAAPVYVFASRSLTPANVCKPASAGAWRSIRVERYRAMSALRRTLLLTLLLTLAPVTAAKRDELGAPAAGRGTAQLLAQVAGPPPEQCMSAR